MMPFDRHVQEPITVCFVQCHVSVRGNVATITDRCANLLSDKVNSRTYIKDSISHTFENPALFDPDKLLSPQFVNATIGIFVSAGLNIKERDTHVSQKSCIIQPIR